MRPPFRDCQSPWIDATLAALTPRQRIAQLLHVASWANRGPAHREQICAQIREHGIGGVIFFQGDPEQQWDFTAAYQAASRVPLMISIDAEWGLAMRLSRSVQFPYAMTLGAVADLELIHAMGAELGRHCRRLGVHVNFAPVVDINTEPDNPVIGFRSFGADPAAVAARAAAFAAGLQSAGVIAVAKHFPGHGDTKVDSHLGLPLLPHGRERLDRVELAPFRHLIEQGVGGIMTGHLRVPALDPEPNVGATLSAPMVRDLLCHELGFEGLVCTDALDMKGVADHFAAAEISRRALLAGNDVLLFCVDVPGSLDAIERAVAGGLVSPAEIDRRCRKLLQAKAWLGLDRSVLPPREGLIEDLHPPRAADLNERLAAASITALRARDGPFVAARMATLALRARPGETADGLAHHELTRTAATGIAAAELLPFQQELAAAGVARHLRFELGQSDAEWDALLAACVEVDEVVLGLHGLSMRARSAFGVDDELRARLLQLLATRKVTLCVFGSDYCLRRLHGLDGARALLLAHQDTPFAQRAAARVVTGAAAAVGLCMPRLCGELPGLTAN